MQKSVWIDIWTIWLHVRTLEVLLSWNFGKISSEANQMSLQMCSMCTYNLQNVFKVPQCIPKHALNTSPTILAATSAIGGWGK